MEIQESLQVFKVIALSHEMKEADPVLINRIMNSVMKAKSRNDLLKHFNTGWIWEWVDRMPVRYGLAAASLAMILFLVLEVRYKPVASIPVQAVENVKQ